MTQSLQEMAQEILRKRGERKKSPALELIVNPDQSPVSRKEIIAFLEPCEPLPQDLDFLMARLPMKSNLRMEVLMGYRSEWLSSMRSEPKEYRKQNAGRHAANTWLRLHSKLATVETTR